VDPPVCHAKELAFPSAHSRIGSSVDTTKTKREHHTVMENQQEAAAVVFPSRVGGSDKQVLQRIHDRNLVRTPRLPTF